MNTRIITRAMLIVFLTIRFNFHVSSQSVSDEIRISFPNFVSQVEWSPDGNKLAIRSHPYIYVYDAKSWERISVFSQPAPIYDIAWHPDSDLLGGVHGGLYEGIMIWDTNTGELIREYSRALPVSARWREGVTLHAIAWHPDGNLIATDAAEPDEILLWDVTLEGGVVEPRVLDTGASIYHDSWELVWSPDGQTLITTGADSVPPETGIFTTPGTHILDVSTGERINALRASLQVWMPDENWMIMTYGARVTVWQINPRHILFVFDRHKRNTVDVEWNEHSGVIASADLDDQLLIWNPHSYAVIDTRSIEFTLIRDLEWQPDSDVLAIAGGDGVVVTRIEF